MTDRSLDPAEMFWCAAVGEHQYRWNRGDSSLFAALAAETFDAKVVWEIAANLSVARNFTEEAREHVVQRLQSARPDGGAMFDWFVSETRALAKEVKSFSSARKGRSFRPLSGVSKLLWHRFPDHGFIFDSRAGRALRAAGLCAPFFDLLHAWGGRPEDNRESDFLIFAAGYQAHCSPNLPPLRDALSDQSLDPRNASRLIDKLLWILGDEKDPLACAQKVLVRSNGECRETALALLHPQLRTLVERLILGLNLRP